MLDFIVKFMLVSFVTVGIFAIPAVLINLFGL